MKVSVYIGSSLDGFIARPDGDIDWLMAADTSDGADDYGYKAFSDSIDCMIMGRNSFEKVLSFPEWPYEGKRLIVLSRTLTALPAELEDNVELYAGPITELVKELEKEGCQRLYIDGGQTIQSFLNEELITDLTITRVPVLLGEGLPLFSGGRSDKTRQDIQLKHIGTRIFENGFVQSTYDVINEV